jgi:hypothetical protein
MDSVQWYMEAFGLDISNHLETVNYAAGRLPLASAPNPFATHHRVLLSTRAAIAPYEVQWMHLQPTNYSLSLCAHAIVSTVFNRQGPGRQLEGLDCLEITHAVLASLHGEEYLLHDRVDPDITAVLMQVLPPLWEALVVMYPVIAESMIGESFVSGVHFDSWQGSDMVLLVETFTPTANYHEPSAPVI